MEEYKGYEFNNSDEIPVPSEDNKFELPCLPDAILPWTDDEKKNLCLQHADDVSTEVRIRKQIFSKLLNVWSSWSQIRNNQLIIDTINAGDLTEREKLLADCIVFYTDITGKILASSHTTDELAWLVKDLNKEELKF